MLVPFYLIFLGGRVGKGAREMIRFKQKLTEKNKVTEGVCKGGW